MRRYRLNTIFSPNFNNIFEEMHWNMNGNVRKTSSKIWVKFGEKKLECFLHTCTLGIFRKERSEYKKMQQNMHVDVEKYVQ